MRIQCKIDKDNLALVDLNQKNKPFPWLMLIGVNLIYACTSIFTKMASQQEFLSLPYIICVTGAIAVMGLYAIIWQQIIARIQLSTAYIFKGTSIIFVLLFSVLLFNESISINNIIGAAIIIFGIASYAKS